MNASETRLSPLHLLQTPPKQARSRLTLHKLLSAAEALLEHGGLDAATVPAIAKAAGVSVGVVYRRFPDKDALLRAVYDRFIATTREENVMRMQAEAAKTLPLPALARAIIIGMAAGYRRKRGILRALRRYVQTHPDSSFRRAAQKLNRETLNAIGRMVVAASGRIGHPNPEMAIEFGLLAVASVLQNVILENESLTWLRMPDDLDEELVRLFFGYLGIRE